jgi:phosphohistidine phosphatase SixA
LCGREARSRGYCWREEEKKRNLRERGLKHVERVGDLIKSERLFWRGEVVSEDLISVEVKMEILGPIEPS